MLREGVVAVRQGRGARSAGRNANWIVRVTNKTLGDCPIQEWVIRVNHAICSTNGTTSATQRQARVIYLNGGLQVRQDLEAGVVEEDARVVGVDGTPAA